MQSAWQSVKLLMMVQMRSQCFKLDLANLVIATSVKAQQHINSMVRFHISNLPRTNQTAGIGDGWHFLVEILSGSTLSMPLSSTVVQKQKQNF